MTDTLDKEKTGDAITSNINSLTRKSGMTEAGQRSLIGSLTNIKITALERIIQRLYQSYYLLVTLQDLSVH